MNSSELDCQDFSPKSSRTVFCHSTSFMLLPFGVAYYIHAAFFDLSLDWICQYVVRLLAL